MRSAVGSVGGVEGDRAVVVDEADEARVLHAYRLGFHRRPQHTLGKGNVAGEFDGVGPRGDAADQRDRVLRMATGAQVGLKIVESLVEVGSGETVTECVENVVGGVAGVASRASSTAEDGGIEQRRLDRPVVANGAGSSIVAPPVESTMPVRNPIEDRCPSPMPRTLITNRRLPAAVPA